MYSVSKTFTFCYGHRLLRDPGRCRHFHGHTVKVTVTIASEKLDDMGMVCHFDRLDSKVGVWIKETFDHHTILSREDPLVAMLKEEGEQVVEIDSNPTAENLAKLIFDRAASEGFNVQEVELWESPTSKATYKKT